MVKKEKFVVVETVLGKFRIAFRGDSVTAIDLYDYPNNIDIFISNKEKRDLNVKEFIVRVVEGEMTAVTDIVISQLYEYFVGVRKSFDFKYELIGTNFQKEVWNKLIEIPYGSLVSYSYIAKSIGSPKSYRAVGNAVGKNPLLILVPCHRVIKQDGSIGGFSSGIKLKEFLIKLEKGKVQ